ncbi:MAG: outer membrane lipoprotein carrier protein LolA [Bacteroidetes bacterium]|nr:outer membrane lipoprotein carrier protein LolA [Bacteroidota bacterium]
MRKLLFILLIFPTLLTAQNSAKDILDKVSQKTASYQTIEAHFINSIISEAAGINESQKGTLYLQGDLYRLEMQGQTIISDGETNWIHLIEEEEVQIMEIDEEEEIISPSKMFTIYQEGYTYQFVEEKNNQFIIDLFPEKSGSFTKIELRVDKEKMHIIGFTLFDKSGNQYAYDVNQFIPNKKFEKNFFQFDASQHPNVDVIDLR